MAKKNVVILEKYELQDTLQVAVPIAPTWEDFEKLAQFLVREYDAEIVEQYDGPYARRWILDVKGQVIELWNDDPYGNYIVAPTNSAEPLLREIGQDLYERLRGIQDIGPD